MMAWCWRCTTQFSGDMISSCVGSAVLLERNTEPFGARRHVRLQQSAAAHQPLLRSTCAAVCLLCLRSSPDVGLPPPAGAAARASTAGRKANALVASPVASARAHTGRSFPGSRKPLLRQMIPLVSFAPACPSTESESASVHRSCWHTYGCA